MLAVLHSAKRLAVIRKLHSGLEVENVDSSINDFIFLFAYTTIIAHNLPVAPILFVDGIVYRMRLDRNFKEVANYNSER